MAKTQAPAFQFYPIDFLNGSKLMTLSERGAYITLLCEQWDQGGVHQDIQALRKLFGCGPVEAERIWRSVSHKFSEGVDGLWRNARLERERKKQAKFRRKQQMNGRLGGRPRKNPGVKSGFDLGLPKKSSSSSSSSSDVQVPPKPPADAGGLPEKVITRSERKTAEHVRRSQGGCRHDPKCSTYEQCLRAIVQQQRALKRPA